MKILSDICIIGGGIAGLTLAHRIARSGATVALVERETLGEGAGYAAAGMLAPLVEAKLEEREDAADLALHGTLAHGGSVVRVGAGALGDARGIGALLRY